MEKIYAGMGFTQDQKAALYQRFKRKADIFPKMIELLNTWGVDQLLPGMTQWYQQAQQNYPQFIDHEVLICIADARHSSNEAIREYRSKRAIARHNRVPDQYFNEYLLVILMQSMGPIVAVESVEVNENEETI